MEYSSISVNKDQRDSVKILSIIWNETMKETLSILIEFGLAELTPDQKKFFDDKLKELK